MVASKFEKATSVKQFKSVAAKSHPVPKGYSTMTATLNVDAEECSLYHVREIKDSIVERANLEPYVTLVQDIHASFVVLTIALPAAVCQHVKSALDVDFLLGLGILPDSVTFGSVPGQRMFFSRLASIRNLFISKGTREEVLYIHVDSPIYVDSMNASAKFKRSDYSIIYSSNMAHSDEMTGWLTLLAN